MASFPITAPTALDDVKITVQDDSPEFTRTAANFGVSSPGTKEFADTALINSGNFTTRNSLVLAKPNKMVNILLRPTVGQIYPRTV